MKEMDAIKILAIGLIAAGILALAYGGFSYTNTTRRAKLGQIEMSVKHKHRVKVPVGVGVVAIAAGGGLLLFGTSKKS